MHVTGAVTTLRRLVSLVKRLFPHRPILPSTVPIMITIIIYHWVMVIMYVSIFAAMTIGTWGITFLLEE